MSANHDGRMAGKTCLITGATSGIGEITALMDRQRSPCGPAWGHIGFSLGYTTAALSSEDGRRQVVIWANGSAVSEEAAAAFWDVAGRLAWQLYCM